MRESIFQPMPLAEDRNTSRLLRVLSWILLAAKRTPILICDDEASWDVFRFFFTIQS